MTILDTSTFNTPSFIIFSPIKHDKSFFCNVNTLFDQSLFEGAIREVKEECGLDVTPNDLTQLAFIDFEFENLYVEGHIF